jgi:hypothetical protein
MIIAVSGPRKATRSPSERADYGCCIELEQITE